MKFIVTLLMLVAGCASVQPREPKTTMPLAPKAEVITWSQSLKPSATWADVAERRFGVRPIVFFCHGRSDNGVWTCYPDAPRVPTPVSSVAWMLHELYPGRAILLIVCNPDGATLNVPGVIYARRSVWNRPGDDWQVNSNDWQYENAVGDISEFQMGQLPDPTQTVSRTQ